jgi:hypothetical protein
VRVLLCLALLAAGLYQPLSQWDKAEYLSPDNVVSCMLQLI